MNRHKNALALGLAGVCAAMTGASRGWNEALEFKAATIIVEVNASAGDAGFQIFLDGEGWKEVRVQDPRRRQVLEAEVDGGARRIGGGTELFLETAEPEYANLDELQELLDLLPEGEYRFVGRTVDGKRMLGTAELSHDVPAGPVVATPVPDPGEECAEGVETDSAVIAWEPVRTTIFGSSDIDIVGYQVIVEGGDPLRHLLVNLTADATQLTVSPEFLEPGTEFKFEILAIEEGGNQTITEGCFVTE